MTNLSTAEPPTAVERMLHLVACGALSQALSVAAELSIVDLLDGDPKSAVELSAVTGCEPRSLRRLLRALASVDVCSEHDDGRFALAPSGALLRSDGNGALRSYLIWWGRYRWPVWSNLAFSIRTGERAGGRVSGTIGMKELDKDSEAAAIFHEAMTEITRAIAAGVIRCCDFTGTRHIVDVGGGHGELLAAVLAANPAMRGVLFDQAHAAEGARKHFRRTGVIDRCEVITGDFFESVPASADSYLLKSVLHDWDDEHSMLILRNCRTAMGDRGKLWLVEQIMPLQVAPVGHQIATVRDLNMLVMLGGRERTADEFRDLLHHTGFEILRIASAPLDFSIIEAVAA